MALGDLRSGGGGGKRGRTAGLASLRNKKAERDTSIFSQVRDIIESAPSGFAHFTAETVKDPIAATATGALMAGPAGAAIGGGVSLFGMGAEYLRTGEGPDFKASKMMKQSFERTARRLGDAAKLDFSRYEKQSDKGGIVGALLEDVANVSIVGSGVSRGLNTASRGAAAEAAAARGAATSAAKAAGASAKLAEQARAAAGAAPDVAMAARIFELDASATKMATVADDAASVAARTAEKAGPIGRAYRISHAVETLGGQGAMLPAKPYIWGAKLAGKPVQAFLRSEMGQPAAAALGRASDRIGTFTAARAGIEAGQQETVRLSVPQAKAIAKVEKLLPDETAHHAALLDMEAAPAGLNVALERLRATGQDDIANQMLDEIANDVELGVTREALVLAGKLEDGSLQVENPELYAAIREAQGIYREKINVPGEERYLDQAGIRGEKTEARQAYREHSVEGTTPDPTRMARTEYRFAKLANDLEGRLERATEKAQKATGKRLLPEGVTPAAAVKADLAEAVRVAETAVKRAGENPEALAQLKAHLKMPESARPEAVTAKLADAILKARRGDKAASDPVLQAAVDAGNWIAPDLRSLRVGAVTRAEKASVKAEAADRQVAKLGALADDAGEAGFRAGTRNMERTSTGQSPAARMRDVQQTIKDLRASRKTSTKTEQPGITAAVKAAQAELRQLKRTRDTSSIIRDVARAEGKEAAFGKLLDDAFGASQREGAAAVAAPAARARVSGQQQGRVLAEGVRAGKREAAAQAALRELGAVERMIARLPEKEARALETTASELKSAPARYRPAIIVARKAMRAGTKMADEADLMVPGAGDAIRAALAEVPTTLKAAVDRGIDPEYVIGGKVRDRATGGAGAGPGTLPLPKTRHTGTEKLRETATGPRSFREAHELNGRRLFQEVQNDTAKAMVVRQGVKPDSVVGVTGHELRLSLVKGDLDAAAGELGYVRVGPLKGDETIFVPKKLAAGGEPLRLAMEERGYVAWDPTNLFEQTPVKQITGTTTFVPEAVFKSFSRQFKGTKAEAAFQKYYDRPMRAWKASVLALSPRWQVGNAIGNAILGTVGAGINPVILGKNMSEAFGLLRREAAGETGLIDPALLKRSVTTAELMEMTPPKTKLGRLVQRSYEANGFVDDMNRVAIWLTESKRLTDRDLHAYVAKHPELAGKTMDEVRNEAAIHLSLRAAGDFTRMLPVERQVFRRLVPFYAWLRHITSLTAKLPVYHPQRTVWMLHLADLYGEPAEFPFLSGAVPGKFLGVGGPNTFLMLPHLNPFSDVGSTRSPGSNLTPALKVPYQMLTGNSLDTGQQITRAPGTGPRDKYGRPTSGPMNPSETAYTLSNLFPQARLGRAVREAVTGGGVKQRYQSGQPIMVRGEPLESSKGTAGSVYGAGAQILGLPRLAEVDLPGLRKRKAERQRQDEQARRRTAPRGSRSTSSSSGGLASLRNK